MCKPKDPLTSLRRTFLIAFGFLIVAIAGLTIFVVLLKLDSRNKDKVIRHTALIARQQAHRSNVALCRLKENLLDTNRSEYRKLKREVRFFRKHPNAFPGVPFSFIQQEIQDDRQGVRARKATIGAISIQRCNPRLLH